MKTYQVTLGNLFNKEIARHPNIPTWLRLRIGMSQTDPHCFSHRAKVERASLTVEKYGVTLRELSLSLPS